MSIKKLQNGSDIRGVAMTGVQGEDVNLTGIEVSAIARSFAHWLSLRCGKSVQDLCIAIGRDSRITGNGLSAAASNTFTAMGIKVLNCGIASTPAMYMALRFEEFNADGSIMFTASHLPFNRNGMKFFTIDGGLEKNDISSLLDMSEGYMESIDDLPSSPISEGIVLETALIDRYVSHLIGLIRREATPEQDPRPLEGSKIIVDAGNGAGGFFVRVLEELGAVTTGSVFLDPDGRFPNHVPNPEDDVAMAAVIKATLDADADLGIIFDTDVDRAAIVDGSGNPINRNRLIALLTAILVQSENNPIIVTDSVTSDGLARFISRSGGTHRRFKRGYKNVINEAIRLCEAGENAPLAIETSGHGAFRENFFLDDGAYIVAKVLIEMARLKRDGRRIQSLIADLDEPLESGEFRMKITVPAFQGYGKDVISKLTDWAAAEGGLYPSADNYEGIRLNSSEYAGWVLVRLSLHDPVLAINIESDVQGGVDILKRHLNSFLSQFEGLK